MRNKNHVVDKYFKEMSKRAQAGLKKECVIEKQSGINSLPKLPILKKFKYSRYIK